MKGYISFRKDRGYWIVGWYNPETGKDIRISKYLDGQRMFDKRLAQKLLSILQGDAERGTFNMDRYKKGYTEVIPFLWEWLGSIEQSIKPATYHDYENTIRNHLTPFFQAFPIRLHEIQYDILIRLKASVNRSGQGKKKVLDCLHTCLDYAWRSNRIPAVPPFPKTKEYQIARRPIKWLPEARQMSILNRIPEAHRPIFLFLKYHYRRPGEAMALYREDWDGNNFLIHRTFSARKLTETTKTGDIHVVPCVEEYRPVLLRYLTKHIKDGIITLSPFLFVNPDGRMQGKPYTLVTMNRIWKEACLEAGEDIDMYSGLKHSSCSQFLNEKGGTLSELQEITDHKKFESVLHYAKTEVARKKELMERKVVELCQKEAY